MVAAHHERFYRVCSVPKSLGFGVIGINSLNNLFVQLMLDLFDGHDHWQLGGRLGLQDIVQPLLFVP
jgi:hypothetical protein